MIQDESSSKDPVIVDDNPTETTSSLLELFTPLPTATATLDAAAERSMDPSVDEEYSDDVDSDDDNDDEDEENDNTDLESAKPDRSAPIGSISHMMAMFAQPFAPPLPDAATTMTTTTTTTTAFPASNSSTHSHETTPLLSSYATQASTTTTTLIPTTTGAGWVSSTEITPKTTTSRKQMPSVPSSAGLVTNSGKHVRHPSNATTSSMPPIEESSSTIPYSNNNNNNRNQQKKQTTTTTTTTTATSSGWKRWLLIFWNHRYCLWQASTYTGSFVFLLYHVVFCLALGSALPISSLKSGMLGLMTKTSALGILVGGISYWWWLPAHELPALYPTVDLFPAPLLAHLAVIVESQLAFNNSNDNNNSNSIMSNHNNHDRVFLATFGILAALGIAISALLLTLASVFRLANLGSFLPFPVICGFFSAVGILTWTLAFNVDTGGTSIGEIVLDIATGSETSVVKQALCHHLPSVVIASAMKYWGPKNPFYVVLVVLSSIALFYIVLFLTGTSLVQAKEQGWFWSHEELVYYRSSEDANLIGFPEWAPPAPFGVWNQLQYVHWGAVWQGFGTAAALGFLYMIRCSVHATALKKNVPNLVRTERVDGGRVALTQPKSPFLPRPGPLKQQRRQFSEAVDLDDVIQVFPMRTATKQTDVGTVKVVAAKPTNMSLKAILTPYAVSQFVSALVGGFAITPTVAAAPTMYMLGAEKVAPQVGSVLLLLVFYLTDFQLVGYIPKPAFSSMLVLAFIDMIYTWFYKSYFKTKDKSEWMVVPMIVVCAFTVGLLSAVFLGIAFSTFLFVAAFFRSGVVKYVADGIAIQSTIERTFKSSEWLNENGDLIQILVLQNYLFFGNANSIYSYIGTLFAERGNDSPDMDDDEERETEKVPRILIIDLTLVTGMDTSTVDVFSDIRNLCKKDNCKLFVAGTSLNLRSVLSIGGFKADSGVRSKRQLRFFGSLDSALGKAEDMLLASEVEESRRTETMVEVSHRRLRRDAEHGFRIALCHIDEEHGDDGKFSTELVGLQEYTSLVELSPNERLYGSASTIDLERGLFFIERGIMKLERDRSDTTTRGSLASLSFGDSGDSPRKIRAISSIGKKLSKLMASQSSRRNVGGGQRDTFRLARIGPGWVAGTEEVVTGVRREGDTVAVTHCRLHHLPFSEIERIETKHPRLVLHLYKLLSYLLARRQEATIGQLATLHSIMTSPALT